MLKDETYFVMKNGRATSPEVTQDGLQVWYDTKGKRNDDTHRDTLLDMSGNERHGELHNFAYERKSGYKDGLVFDGIDDTLTRPEVEGIEDVSGSRNLINIDKDLWEIGSVNGNVSSGVDFSTNNTFRSYYLKLKAGNYTFNAHPLDLPENESLRYWVHCYDLDRNGIAISSWRNSGNPFNYVSEEDFLVRVLLRPIKDGETYNVSKDYLESKISMQVEEGSVATPYTPYIPSAKLTYQLNGNILSYDEGGIVRRVHNGEVIERKGINLVRNGNFTQGLKDWSFNNYFIAKHGELRFTTPENTSGSNMGNSGSNIVAGNKYYVSLELVDFDKERTHFRFHPFFPVTIYRNITEKGLIQSIEEPEGEVEALMRVSHHGASSSITNIQVIDLTATFGAGNEPTLEQIQAEPDKWAWTPNPLDLLEAKTLKGNIMGDVENIIDDLNKDEVSGQSPIFSDKADDAIVRVEVDGKSKQGNPPYREVIGESVIVEDNEEDELRKLVFEGKSVGGGSGKNLFNAGYFIDNLYENGYDREANLVDIETNHFQYETIGNIHNYMNYLSGSFKENTPYTISLKGQILNESDSRARSTLSIRYTDGTLEFIGTLEPSKEIILTKTSSGLKTVSHISANWQYNGLANIKYFQIEEGSTATQYEPPVPTPDYPILITSVDKDLTVTSAVGNRNLFSIKHLESLPDVSQFGTSKIMNLKLKPNTNYTVSTNMPHWEDIPETGYIYYNGWTGNGVTSVHINHPQTRNSGENGELTLNIIHSRFGLEKLLDGTYWIKWEEGSFATPYTPAPEDLDNNTVTDTLTKVNLLLDEPLRSVGEVKDRLFKDVDELWKVRRNVGEAVLDGTRSWYIGHATSGWSRGNGTTPFYVNPAVGNHKRDGISKTDKFRTTIGSRIVVNNEESFSLGHSFYNVIRIKTERIQDETVSSFKDWLEANPVNVQYELDNPVTKTLSESEQANLNTLYSLYPTPTYLDTLSDVKGTLTAGYKILPEQEAEGDILAPTPDYPEVIQSLSKQVDIVSSVGKKNILNNSRLDYILGSGSYTVSELRDDREHGIVYVTDRQYIHDTSFSANKDLKKGEVVTISIVTKIENSSDRIRLQFHDGESVTGNINFEVTDEWQELSETVTLVKDLKKGTRLYIYPRENICYIKSIKVEKGSVATPYTPAPEDLEYNTLTHNTYKTTLSLSEPLRSVGDVSDRLFRDSDGLWKVERNIREHKYNSRNNQVSLKQTNDFQKTSVFNLHSGIGLWTHGSIICSHLNYQIGRYRIDGYIGLTSWSGENKNTTVMICIPNEIASTTEEMNAWLQHQTNHGKPLTLTYQIATPIIETLPNEDQLKLNSIPSYDGTTYVYTVDTSGLETTLHAKFKPADWYKENKLVNSLKIYDRSLEDEELLLNYSTEKSRFGL